MRLWPLAVRLAWPRPLVVFAAALSILILRMPETLFRAEFYADDGYLYSRALVEPPTAMFEPYAGYLHVGQRAVVYLETVLPPAFAPLIGSMVMLMVIAGVALLACSPRMPWKRRDGLLIAFGIALLPASFPIVGNLAHVIWPIMLWMGLTAVSAAPRWLRAESVGLFLGGLTGPGAVILWPLFVSGPRRRLIAVGTAAVIQLVVIATSHRTGMFDLDPLMLPYIVLMRGLVTPLLGPSIATAVGPLATVVLGALLAFCAGVLLLKSRHRLWIGYLLVAFPAAGILFAGVPTGWYANAELFPRYFWITSAALVILIVLGRRRLAVVPLAAALMVGIVSEARIEPWEDMQWSERSACIGGPVPCEVPVAPLDVWNVHWQP